MALSSTGNTIYFGDNLAILQRMPAESVDLIYIDPPFNTGKIQTQNRIRVAASDQGDRVGFQGKRYASRKVSSHSFDDRFEDYLAFLEPRLREAHRVLSATGALYFHTDYREVHYCKILLDRIFGRACFLNEIIWAYDYGGRSRRKWAAKHDNILYYVKNPDEYVFNISSIDRIPYMAPGLVGAEKAKAGKIPTDTWWDTDTWWHTIVPTNSRERTGYPTQKPIGILKRIIAASSLPEEVVLDFFAGSGTTGMVADILNRRFILIDNNVEAMRAMAVRFQDIQANWVNFDPEPFLFRASTQRDRSLSG